MREYTTDKIRNVGVLGHGGAGKTSLMEALLFDAGVITRMGSTTSGNTVSDFDPEEIKRQISIHATLLPVETNDIKINFIDTPGYADFLGESISTIRVVDSAVFVFDAVDGFTTTTDLLWKLADKKNLPRLVLINRMDHERADFGRVLEDARKKFGNRLVPIGPGMEQYREMLVEIAAEVDESLLEKYMEGKPISDEELSSALNKGVPEGKIIPVIAGSALKNQNTKELVEAIIKWLPSPRTDRDSFSAYVFKTVVEPHVGELTYIKVCSGTLNASASVYNPKRSSSERVGQIAITRGKQKNEVPSLQTGDIAALPKLKSTRTGDTLCCEKDHCTLPMAEYPEAAVKLAVRPRTKSDQEKMAIGFSNFMKEDPTFKMYYDPETKESIISGMGDVHLEIYINKLKERYKIEIETQQPRIPYKETIMGRAKGQGKHKKQTGGHGQYGDAWLEIEPLPRGQGFEFVNKVVGGAIPKNYIPAVEKGVTEMLEKGVIAGYPIVDVRVTLYDGSYHDVDSSDLSFKIAAHLAMKKVFPDARPAILEPIAVIQVNVPARHVGEVVNDMNKRRGRIVTIEEEKVVAQVPMAEIANYASQLRSFTHGAGTFSTSFSHYEQVQPKTQQELCEKFKLEKEKGSSEAR
ncbi:MAG: elongation factor G [Candidatus Margulisiibacteriota bacterium]